MNSTEFWKKYKEEYKKYEGPGFNVLDRPLSGDHGVFEMAVFMDDKGVWCYEETIERSNKSHRVEFHSEEEAIEYIVRKINFGLNIEI